MFLPLTKILVPLKVKTQEKLSKLRGRLLRDKPLSQYTSWQVGGLAEYIYQPSDVDDLAFFLELNGNEPATPDEIGLFEVAPAYIISELKSAFEIGFIIFIPFIVLDLVVANVLLALGMFMLSPTIISLPFKLLIFISVDGWSLIVNGLVQSFN